MKSLEIVNVLIKCSEFITNDTIGISKETVYQIKQDLEVLEILMKKFEFEPIDSDTNIISEDEMNKLKQWLEENENDK